MSRGGAWQRWFLWGAVLSLGACQGSGHTGGEGGGTSRHGGSHLHRGPAVADGPAGPARFAPAMMRAFDTDAAMEAVTFIDGYYRAPANEGYEASLDYLADRLRRAGYGSRPGLELRFIEGEPEAPAWTPRLGSLVLLEPGKGPLELHAFSTPEDTDRVMLPVNAPSCDLTARVALSLSSLEPGDLLVTDAPLRQVIDRAKARQAAAVVSSSLYSFNTDPTGRERHLDAIQYRTVSADIGIPVFQIAPRTLETIRKAHERSDGAIQIRAQAVVEQEERPLRTLVATVVGDEKPDEAVAIASHVQEPGACDNASGCAGLAESAVSLAHLLVSKELDWPARTMVFLWGDEFRQSRDWLETTERTPIIGISSDMTGESAERTGAIALLERMPDPGALAPLPPDEHTPWGAGHVNPFDFKPNALSVIARCALHDVGSLSGDPWETADHPWEGGSDHDEFIERGIPAVLFWHFTDFSYHTSLDRLDMVDPQELRRTQVALLATAMAVADPDASDRQRYRNSVRMEQELRMEAAQSAENGENAEAWEAWCDGACEWIDSVL